jgi:DNA primase
MISHTTIDKLRDIPILQVVQKYDDITLKKSGASYKGLSPWSTEKSGSFFVHPGKNIFKCFSSGKGGNNGIAFVMQKDNLEFVDAAKSLAQKHGIEIEYDHSEEAKSNWNETKMKIRQSLDYACAHYCANDIPESFTKYRAFPEAILETFKVGYAKPSWDDLMKSMLDPTGTGIMTQFNSDTMVLAGLLRKRENSEGHYDAYRDRIMFPIMDYRGNIVAFTARDAETQPLKEGTEKPPKYINSPDTCFDKSHNLYGLYQAIKGGKLKDGAFVVEGPTDVLRWHLHGFTNTVAPCGSAFTEQQAKLLKRFTDKIIFVPDNDCDKDKNAGLDALERNAPIAIKAGFTVKVLIPGR